MSKTTTALTMAELAADVAEEVEEEPCYSVSYWFEGDTTVTLHKTFNNPKSADRSMSRLFNKLVRNKPEGKKDKQVHVEWKLEGN